MYGDIGHGTCLLIFALFLVLFEHKLKEPMESNEIFSMLYSGRYMLLLMGMFSIYTGILYNELFGLSLNFWGSRWTFNGAGLATYQQGNTYEFGIDPAWYDTTNQLSYSNSLKMKMAIVFGVSHMLLGTVFKFMNFVRSRKYAFIFMEVIPEFLILGCSFGYLAFIIIYKWCINWGYYGAVAPDLLNTMTDYFLHFYTPIVNKLYSGQQYVQITLLAMVVLSIPVLLIASPVYEIIENKIHTKLKKGKITHGHEFNAQAVIIHSLIHTIEQVLGAVSNTASYLRLWALSLAHSQLSEVFFSLTVRLALTFTNLFPKFSGLDTLTAVLDYTAIPMVVLFSIWLGLTMMVLLGMESLSAFLHSLRLHWVEFNGRYYKGDGHEFKPMIYNQILLGVEEK